MPAKSSKLNVPVNATEPTSDEIIMLLPSVTSFTSDEDRIARAKILWYKVNGETIPVDVFLSSDLSLSEYEEYAEAISKDYKAIDAPTYSLSDVLSKVYPNLAKRTQTTHIIKYCHLHSIDYAELKKVVFNTDDAQKMFLKLKNWVNPKSRKTAASNAGKISALLRYAKKRPDEFEIYLDEAYHGETHKKFLQLWLWKQDDNALFNEQSEKDINEFYGALKSFREKNLKVSKKKLEDSVDFSPIKKVSFRSKQ